MKKWWLITIIIFCQQLILAQHSSGVYSYNKGLNKSNGSIYLTQFCSDSAFLYIQASSGAPDFNMTDIKVFIKIDSNKGYYKAKDSCSIVFNFYKDKLQIQKHSACKHEFNLEGNYKRVQMIAKRNANLLLPFMGQKGFTKLDTVYVLNAPHSRASKQFSINKKETPVQILDEYSSYYLISTSSHKNEFLWIDKKSLTLSK